MAIWIRSQDARTLVESRRVIILAPNTYRKKWVIANFEALRPVSHSDSCEDFDYLGEYESEKECMEVLDHMQRHVLIHPYVYNMPKREELIGWMADKARSKPFHY